MRFLSRDSRTRTDNVFNNVVYIFENGISRFNLGVYTRKLPHELTPKWYMTMNGSRGQDENGPGVEQLNGFKECAF